MAKGGLILSSDLYVGAKLCGVLDFKFQVIEVAEIVERGSSRDVLFKPSISKPFSSSVGGAGSRQVFRLAQVSAS